MPNVMRWAQVLIDVFLLSFAFVAAYVLRYDFSIPLQVYKQLAFQMPYVVILEYGLLVSLGAHRVVWRFVTAADVITLAKPLLIAAAVLIAVRIIVPVLPFGHRIYLLVPFGVSILNLLLGIFAILGSRLLRRLWTEDRNRKAISQPARVRRILLVGAGEAGVLVAREVTRRPDLGLVVVGFVDDDKHKWNTSIGGHPVLAGLADLGKIIKERKVDDVVIAIAGAPNTMVRQVLDTCDEARVSAKIIPGLYEIIGGRVSVTRLREVQIEDLLGRDAVQLDTDEVAAFIEQKVIAVTGAGGSIGSELCRQLLRFKPQKLLLLEQAENSLFFIHQELLKLGTKTEIVPLIADVTDQLRINQIFSDQNPSSVFHAAAHKHVPMMELNPGEAVKNNIFGTKTVADAADAYGVDRFVLISTDKAVNPSSVMGCSKRVAELYVRTLSEKSATKFNTVRFGNVLGSAGSVIPIFRKQIEQGGPVTVTHEKMTRYFMTIPEACQLVLQAGTMGAKGGELFILDMGKPVKIVDLARDLIRLSGLEPGKDITIEFSGTRPGEKLYEELSSTTEGATKTQHPKIFIGAVQPQNTNLETGLSLLKELATKEASPSQIVGQLRQVVPEFQSPTDTSA